MQESTGMSDQEILERFDSHILDEEGREQVAEFRDHFKTLALFLTTVVPDSRVRSIALMELEIALMWCVKAISDQYPVSDD